MHKLSFTREEKKKGASLSTAFTRSLGRTPHTVIEIAHTIRCGHLLKDGVQVNARRGSRELAYPDYSETIVS